MRNEFHGFVVEPDEMTRIKADFEEVWSSLKGRASTANGDEAQMRAGLARIMINLVQEDMSAEKLRETAEQLFVERHQGSAAGGDRF
ncbi:hypothetical protein [Oricola cellulosilytica]|uniref:Uncharacterized protein n=1 Tax=Oricola cellulosilytica TaxID=1429082 RepID=A0A4R0PG71_9HYPH|nr:hypothetical protein [Oricola cellulosilytica]TCD16088.1 hypothetical protein E0D97_01205 [Oricola cellulosilytica]